MPRQISLPIPVEELRTTLRSHGIRKAHLFGSYARGEQRPTSDVDILIDPAGGVGLFEIINLQQQLESRTGVRFELVTQIREPFRRYIEADLVDLDL